jgi:hypothetical protein
MPKPNAKVFSPPQARGHWVDHWVSFHVLGTSGTVDPPEPLKYRLVCDWLLTQLPDEGLPEALESLAQMWRFYRIPVTEPPMAPALASVLACWGATYVRPVFPVTEE